MNFKISIKPDGDDFYKVEMSNGDTSVERCVEVQVDPALAKLSLVEELLAQEVFSDMFQELADKMEYGT